MSALVKRLGLLWTVSLLLVASLAASDLQLVDATQRGDGDTVRSLLNKHVDVNTPQNDGTTAIAWAAYRDDLETAQLLISAGAKVNAANQYGVTPLWLACGNGSAAMVGKLLEAGAEPNDAKWTGATPLMMCARTGNVEAVQMLITHEANVNAAETNGGQTALMWAAAQKHTDVVKALIEHGADVKAHAKSGFTPLMFAAQQGDMDAAKMLLAAGANINDVTNDQGTWVGDTALLVATESGYEDLSIFLLDKGADPNAADEFGFTAMDFAMMKGLIRVVGVRIPDYAFDTYMFRPNMTELVKALLAHGADPNARIKKYGGGNKLWSVGFNDPDKFTVSEVGATPFLLAAYTHDLPIMRMLVAAGADPMLSTEGGTTPLMMAAGVTRRRAAAGGGGSAGPLPEDEAKKAMEAVKLCIELGNDVNAANDFGLTALFGATFNGSNDMIRFLVAKGANVNAKDAAGQTPLQMAMNIWPEKRVSTGRNGHDILIPYTYWKDTAALLIQLGATPIPGAPVVAQGSSAGVSTVAPVAH